jgi:integrase
MLPGERNREFVLTGANRDNYFGIAPEPLRSIAVFLLETGLRLGEALALMWCDVHLNPLGEATRGYISIPKGKSKYAKRNISLTDEARTILVSRRELSSSDFVFVRDDHVSAVSRFTLSSQHERVKKALKLPDDFVLHSLRHTMLTNLAASGADAFVIQRVAGHSSIVISQKYVHPTPESLEKAFARLEQFSKGSKDGSPEALTPTTKSTTIGMSSSAM